MSKRKNNIEPRNDPQPSASKRARNSRHHAFRAARNREPDCAANPTSSSTSTTSQVTTLALTSNGRRKGKHKSRSHIEVTDQASSTPDPSLTPVDDTRLDAMNFQPPASKLLEWLSFRDTTLDEILRHDGLGDFLGHEYCLSCNKDIGVYKCKDCSGGCRLRCRACMVVVHQHTPLHRIERWTGHFFDKDSLQNLGLRVQLRHGGGPCPCPAPGPPTFKVFDTSGIHSVNIDYCECSRDSALDRRTQLLRQAWFPATFSRPNTVFTFDCLDTFHEHTLQAKGNLYDFYHLLVRKTDSANISKSIYRYKEFHRVYRIWRNLMVLKRSGRGHDPAGISVTSPGSMTVECPACPHPGRNLPDNWTEAGPLMFLYILYISVDANFKLKGKERGLKDVELMPGWGPYVEESAYQNFIADYVDQPEINTCESEHDAIVRAQTRCTPGYSVSGVGIVICSRHVLVRKNGAGDLQKGKKYCNMDYIIFAALVGICLPWIFITYDIGCQWSINFHTRMLDFPEHMRIDPATKIGVAVPSWHINGHGKRCRKDFCLGYMKGAGRTCGEEVETSWSHTNPLGPSVREMAPAARHDTLNDHWNGWNFRKIVGFRTLFAKRFREAALMSAKHTETFEKFSTTFPPEVVGKWVKMVERWDADPKAPNPYDEPEKTTTLQDVRLDLTRIETIKLASGQVPRHKVTMMGFFSMGFDIEDQQFVLKHELSRSKGKKTSKQLADLEEKRSALIRQILVWRPVQLAYTPHVATLLPLVNSNDEAGIPYTNPESMTLFFPSSLPPEIRNRPELKEIHDTERRLREPQAHDALADVRRIRRIIQGLWLFKKFNVSGTGNGPNTRMLDMYNRLEYKLRRAANRYRVAYTALLALDQNGSWRETLKELNPADLRGPGRDPEHLEDAKTSNGRYIPSWIWLTPRASQEKGDDQTEEEFNDSMRTEWAQIQARMCQWNEEFLILQEEMRRVLCFFEWKSAWWLEQGNRRKGLDLSIQSGIVAYAHKQSSICLRMAARCAAYWLPIMGKAGIVPTWSEKYKGGSTTTLEGDPSSDSDDNDGDIDETEDKSDGSDVEVDDMLDFD